MSLIKTLQDFVEKYDGMTLQVMTDIAGENPGSYALAPSGNNKIITDIVGNKTFVNNYIFYAKENTASEYDRAENYDALEGFVDWLDGRNDYGDLPVFGGRWKAEKLEVSNLLLFDISDDGTGIYQVQIALTIRKDKI